MEQQMFEVLNSDPIRRVELALEDLRHGKMVILVDDEDRENEGDLVVAAEKITAEHINFMATHARGLICLSMTGEQVERLGLPMMATNNQSPYNTAFTVSIEAREGVTTGISASDRALTCQVAIREDATPRTIVTPGHMFPLRARDGGVLERVGQTEGSVDLARLAGLNPSGVICEVMKDDGTMARMPDLEDFGRTHEIRIVAVADIIKYRMRHERVVRRTEVGTLDIPGVGTFQSALFEGNAGDLHMALFKGSPTSAATLCRVQTAPPPWAFLNADTSRFASSAKKALQQVDADGVGAVVFMHVATSRDHLGVAFKKDFQGVEGRARRASAEALRDLGAGCQILLDLGFGKLRLMTNSDRPILGIEAYGLEIVERVAL